MNVCFESQIPRSKLWDMTWLVLSAPRAGYLHPQGTYPRGIRQISAQARLLGSLLARENFLNVISRAYMAEPHTRYCAEDILTLEAEIKKLEMVKAFLMDITLHSLLLYGSIGMSATLLAGGISLPCAYLFEPEKSQIVFMMSFMASTGYYLMNIG